MSHERRLCFSRYDLLICDREQVEDDSDADVDETAGDGAGCSLNGEWPSLDARFDLVAGCTGRNALCELPN